MPNVFEDLKAGRDRLNAYHESYQRWRGNGRHGTPEQVEANEPAAPPRHGYYALTRPRTSSRPSQAGSSRASGPYSDDYSKERPPSKAGGGNDPAGQDANWKAGSASNRASTRPSRAGSGSRYGDAAPPKQPPPTRRPPANPQSFSPPPIRGNAHPTAEQVEASRHENASAGPHRPAPH